MSSFKEELIKNLLKYLSTKTNHCLKEVSGQKKLIDDILPIIKNDLSKTLEDIGEKELSKMKIEQLISLLFPCPQPRKTKKTIRGIKNEN